MKPPAEMNEGPEALARFEHTMKALSICETKNRGENAYLIMFQEGSDRFTGRRDIHVDFDRDKRQIIASVTQTNNRTIFNIVADEDGNPMFELAGKRYTVEELSREVLKPHLAKMRA